MIENETYSSYFSYLSETFWFTKCSMFIFLNEKSYE